MAATPEAAELVTSFYRYAVAVARRAGRRWPRLRDEFESDCLLVLFRAARSYPGDPAQFKPYLATALIRTIGGRLHRDRTRDRLTFGDQGGEDGRGVGSDPLALIPGRELDPAVAAELADALEHLPADERAMLELHAEGYSLDSIGEALGVTGSRVRQRVVRAVRQLRDAI